MNVNEINVLVLAYLGDTIYEAQKYKFIVTDGHCIWFQQLQ